MGVWVSRGCSWADMENLAAHKRAILRDGGGLAEPREQNAVLATGESCLEDERFGECKPVALSRSNRLLIHEALVLAQCWQQRGIAVGTAGLHRVKLTRLVCLPGAVASAVLQ